MGATVLPTVAQSPLFDNWNRGACGVTRTAAFVVDQETRLERLELWYNWLPNEASLSYTASFNNQAAFSGALVRAECDTYQPAWCVGRGEPGVDLSPGIYIIRTQRAAICQNAVSRGVGFVRVFGSATAAAPTMPPSATPLQMPPSSSMPQAPPPANEPAPAQEAPIEPAPSGSGVYVPSR